MATPGNSSKPFVRNSTNNALLEQLKEYIETNLRNEQFGVEELAEQMNMSRSHLYRKLQQATGQSINQFIREYRLQRALELLQDENITVSEIAHQVGFGSTTYFTTCFTELYGYPPGEARRKLANSSHSDPTHIHSDIKHQNISNRRKAIVVSTIALGLLISIVLYWLSTLNSNEANISTDLSNKSIAVLPFKNLNPDQENEYFSEGVVGAITRHLSAISDLRVISRTSMDRYRESALSALEIANDLNVSNLLEGSIQRHENTVRIEVRLIDAKTESQIWAENYDRELEDILKTQSEIAEKVALSLQAKLSQEEKLALKQNHTVNAKAYDLYLKGIYESRTYTRNGVHRSKEYFKQAIALDSNFALAYSGLAISYITQAAIFASELSALEAFEKAKPILDKALELDPDLVETHTWNGFYLLYKDWDFKGAKQEYLKGVNSNNPDALALYTDILNFTQQHEEALVMARKLNQMNPFYPGSRMIQSLYYNEKYEEAVEFAESRLNLFDTYYTLDSYGFLMLNTGNFTKSIQLFQKAMDDQGLRVPRMVGWMGAAYAKSGQKEKALALIEELKTKRQQTDAGSPAFFIAVIYAALNNRSMALHYLQEAYEHHEMEIPWLKSEPQFYALHNEPEFKELVQNVGFP